MEDPYNENFLDLHNSMEEVASQIKSLKPKTIILLTPHGYSIDDGYLVYLHEKFTGSFFKIDPNKSVVHGELLESQNWEGDLSMAKLLLTSMKERNLPVEGLTLGYPGYPLTLSWGAAVPLYYVGRTLAKIVIVGIPRSRHEKIDEIQTQLQRISETLLKICETQENIVIVFSGDLSHVHDINGPYGFHDSGKLFDEYVQHWAQNPKRETFNKLLTLQPTALACGMVSMSILQGIFDQTSGDCKMLEYGVPTYFGMPVIMWEI